MTKAYVCTTFGGCALNSHMLTKIYEFLIGNNIEIVQKAEYGDIIIIATCANVKKKEQESIEFVKSFIQSYGGKKQILLCGCLPQINPSLNKEKGIIAIGPTELDKLNDLFKAAKKIGEFKANLLNKDFCNCEYSSSADYYLEICRGCVNNCSYCVIKRAKGNVKSRPIDEIILQLKEGIDRGFRRFVLLGDDCGSYGLDIGTDFAELLYIISKIKKNREDFELVVHYFEPKRLLKLYSKIKLFINKLNISNVDIPLQSGNNRIIELMNRKYKVEDVIKIIKDIKRVSPSTKIHTHIISCFPSETRSEFLDFHKAIIHFDTVSFFFYSDREKTPASRLNGKINKREYSYRVEYIRRIVETNPNKYHFGNLGLLEETGEKIPESLLKTDYFSDTPEVTINSREKNINQKEKQIKK